MILWLFASRILSSIYPTRITCHEKQKCASAGNRTRIYCLEGNNANLYTTDAGEDERDNQVKIIHSFEFKLRLHSASATQVPVAQWIARRTSNPEVVGSNPTGDAIFSISFKMKTSHTKPLELANIMHNTTRHDTTQTLWTCCVSLHVE